MRKVKTFAEKNGWEYEVTEHEEVRIEKDEIIVIFAKYSSSEYSMFVRHVEAILGNCSPLIIERLYSNQGQCLENLDETIEEILERAEKFLTEESENDSSEFDNEMTLDEQLDTKEFKDLTVDQDDAEYKKERLEHERINLEYNQMVNEAHMNNADRLQATVNQAFGEDTTILRSNERYVLVRYSKGDSAEFATLMHDWDSVYFGHYFTAWSVSVDDYSNVHYKAVRDRAIADYENRIK